MDDMEEVKKHPTTESTVVFDDRDGTPTMRDEYRRR